MQGRWNLSDRVQSTAYQTIFNSRHLIVEWPQGNNYSKALERFVQASSQSVDVTRHIRYLTLFDSCPNTLLLTAVCALLKSRQAFLHLESLHVRALGHVCISEQCWKDLGSLIHHVSGLTLSCELDKTVEKGFTHFCQSLATLKKDGNDEDQVLQNLSLQLRPTIDALKQLLPLLSSSIAANLTLRFLSIDSDQENDVAGREAISILSDGISKNTVIDQLCLWSPSQYSLPVGCLDKILPRANLQTFQCNVLNEYDLMLLSASMPYSALHTLSLSLLDTTSTSVEFCRALATSASLNDVTITIETDPSALFFDSLKQSTLTRLRIHFPWRPGKKWSTKVDVTPLCLIPSLTSLDIVGEGQHAHYYQLIQGLKDPKCRLSSFHLYNNRKTQHLSCHVLAQEFCSMLHVNKSLTYVMVGFDQDHSGFAAIDLDLANNIKKTYNITDGHSWPPLTMAAIRAGRMRWHNWIRICPMLAFIRADPKHPFCNSIQPLLSTIALFLPNTSYGHEQKSSLINFDRFLDSRFAKSHIG